MSSRALSGLGHPAVCGNGHTHTLSIQAPSLIADALSRQVRMQAWCKLSFGLEPQLLTWLLVALGPRVWLEEGNAILLGRSRRWGCLITALSVTSAPLATLNSRDTYRPQHTSDGADSVQGLPCAACSADRLRLRNTCCSSLCLLVPSVEVGRKKWGMASEKSRDSVCKCHLLSLCQSTALWTLRFCCPEFSVTVGSSWQQRGQAYNL